MIVVRFVLLYNYYCKSTENYDYTSFDFTIKLLYQPKVTVAVTGSDSLPSPRLLEAYTLANIPVELEHTALKSNTLLQLPLMHEDAKIFSEPHLVPDNESE